jgi:hypothetical protein
MFGIADYPLVAFGLLWPALMAEEASEVTAAMARLLQEIKLVIVDAADRTKVIEHDDASNEPVLIEDKKED